MGRRKKRAHGELVSRDSDYDSDSGSDSDFSGCAYMKIRDTAPSRSKLKRSGDKKPYELKELKDMRKLDRNDEAFHLSWTEISDITDIICSRRTPTFETYKQWDEYEASFYLKMCDCFGFDYQNLEPEDENERIKLLSDADQPIQITFDNVHKIRELMEKKTRALLKQKESLKNKLPTESTSLEKTQPLTKEQELIENKLPMVSTSVEKTQPLTKEQKQKRLEYLMNLPCNSVKPTRSGPLKTGSYSTGNEPDRIPYHLYLLIKEAVDIMKRNDLKDLEIVEKKIKFFCTYFHSHLQPGFKYERAKASSLIAEEYDIMRRPKYRMTGYTPSRDLDFSKMDVKTCLSEQLMANIMNIIYSRKNPTFIKWGWSQISFYCKICSCFGINYHRLEDASEDDLCLMNMGTKD